MGGGLLNPMSTPLSELSGGILVPTLSLGGNVCSPLVARGDHFGFGDVGGGGSFSDLLLSIYSRAG